MEEKLYLIILDVYGDVEIRCIKGDMLEEYNRYINVNDDKEHFCYLYAEQLKLPYNEESDIMLVTSQAVKPNVNRKTISKI